MEAIARGEYRSLREFRSDVPESLDEVLRKALSVNPKDRFKDAAEFEKAIVAAYRSAVIPGVGEDEIGIFLRTLFRKSVDEKDGSFMSGYAWLLTQIQGHEQAGVELARRVAEAHPTRPYVQLNLARSLLSAGDKIEGLRLMRRLSRVDSLEEVSQEILEWLGVRRRPVVSFLKRSHPLNHALGVVRHRVLGPTPFQRQFLAA
jgi:predicted Zn-dependent protease